MVHMQHNLWFTNSETGKYYDSNFLNEELRFTEIKLHAQDPSKWQIWVLNSRFLKTLSTSGFLTTYTTMECDSGAW